MRKLLFTILSLTMLVSCGYHEENVTTCGVVAKKHTEQESIGSHGDFRTVHYFYTTNGELHKVNLETYLKYEIGDEVCFTELIWVKDKPEN